MIEKIYGLLGRSLAHSYSARIHELLGCAHYRLIELEPTALGAFLCSANIGGLNVTMPYKVSALTACQFLSDEAREIGCVNTIVRKADGALLGCNTDAVGLEYAARRAGISFSGGKTLIFGSGGAAKTARYVARRLGADSVITISRTGNDNYQNISRHYDARILINATPVGMYPACDGCVTDISYFTACEGVIDLVYNPRRTDLLLQAEKFHIAHTDGLSMLVHQAKAAQEIFFDCMISDSETERVLCQVARETENIVLIGMPGSGKTTVGRIVADISARECVDTDSMIAEQAGCSIEDIFEHEGEAGFRERERLAVAQAALLRGVVIVTGGGAVTTPENCTALRRSGRIFQISQPLDRLAREGRPLYAQYTPEELFARRQPLYESTRDAEIDNTGTPKQTAQLVWQTFCEICR